jgi:hypothetical protein
MKLFCENIRYEIDEDFDLMKVISHRQIKDNYDFVNNQLISKHVGNRRPRLQISFDEILLNNARFLQVSIGLTSVIKRLIIVSCIVVLLVGVFVLTHLFIFEFPMLTDWDSFVRLIFYLYPLLGVFTLGIYYLSFRTEVSEFEKIFRAVIRISSKTS